MKTLAKRMPGKVKPEFECCAYRVSALSKARITTYVCHREPNTVAVLNCHFQKGAHPGI